MLFAGDQVLWLVSVGAPDRSDHVLVRVSAEARSRLQAEANFDPQAQLAIGGGDQFLFELLNENEVKAAEHDKNQIETNKNPEGISEDLRQPVGILEEVFLSQIEYLLKTDVDQVGENERADGG